MREGLAYRIVGGVRFYERKEIKDILAFLKLAVEPEDDVSMRRVINVPPRGIGKGVMEALEQIGADDPADSPLFAHAGAAPARPSLWRRLGRAVDERLVPTRAAAALAGFRTLLQELAAIAATESASVTLERTLHRTGYLQALEEANTEEAEGRLANLAELVSAARDYELREDEASLAGFIDRLSLRSETDEEQGDTDARIWLMTLHAAKGLEFPLVIIAGMEEGLFPHQRSSADDAELEGGAPAVLRRDDAGRIAACPDQRCAAAGIRRVPLHRGLALSRRDSARAGGHRARCIVRAARAAAAGRFQPPVGAFRSGQGAGVR